MIYSKYFDNSKLLRDRNSEKHQGIKFKKIEENKEYSSMIKCILKTLIANQSKNLKKSNRLSKIIEKKRIKSKLTSNK
jgi:hypothetical protein